MTFSLDFPTTADCPGDFFLDSSHNGFEDTFVAILGPAGTSVLYGTFLGGGSSDLGLAIARAGDDVVLVAGATASGDFPTSTGTHAGHFDGFVAVLRFAASEPTGCTGGFTVGPTTVTQDPIAPSGAQLIGTQVCSGTAASDILVDLEIYDAGGQKIAQRIFGGQSFQAGQSIAYSWDYAVPAALPDGVYTVKIGVFSGDWSTLHVSSWAARTSPPGKRSRTARMWVSRWSAPWAVSTP
jgi:hypothetical protein